MGAAHQKNIKDIIASKYSFTNQKVSQPFVISAWKYTQEELELNLQCAGISMGWPFKFYSDEGYILAVIEDKSWQGKEWIRKSEVRQGWRELGELKVSVNVIQLLYSFLNGQIEEYSERKIVVENKSKYIKDNLQLTLYVYVGQNLSSVTRLKLLSYSISLERYISRGGICSISKLYHESESIINLEKQIKIINDSNPMRESQYFVEIAALIQDRIKIYENDKQMQEVTRKQLSSLLLKFKSYKLLKRLLIEPCINQEKDVLYCFTGVQNTAQPNINRISIEKYSSNLQLMLKQPDRIKNTQRKEEVLAANLKKQKQNDLNMSLPFACEITQINYKQKKKIGEAELNDSISMIGLDVLNQNKKKEFVRMVSPDEDYIILTDYASIKDYNQCLEYHLRLVINTSPNNSYNYYLNDFQYQHFYISQLPNKMPPDPILFENNIENIILRITESIVYHTKQNKKGDAYNNRAAICSSTGLFCDENCAVIIGYYIARYLYTFEKAYEIINKAYREYKGDKSAKFELHKIYIDQLLTLQARILIASSPTYGVSLNHSFWRVYQVTNNHFHPSQQLITRYIGQITNLNQIQSLQNHNHHCFIAVSHQIVPIIGSVIEKWEKDPTIKPPVGLTGIKILLGKQFEFKNIFVAKAKETIPFILKYQFCNRNKHPNTFNNQFLFKFLEEIVASNVQIESIEKSFRKPQPFIPLYIGFEEESPAKPSQLTTQPYNPKEKLTFKYPYLRPIWQQIKDDQYYYIIQLKNGCSADIRMLKGNNWIGYEQDKETYFGNIVRLYLQNIDQSKIWVNETGQLSIFGDSSVL